MLIRVVKKEDIRDVYRLYCDEEMLPRDKITEEEYKQAENIYEDLLNKGSYALGIWSDNVLIGVVTVYKNMQYYPLNLDKPYVHLECVIIKKEFQNKGIGTLLVSEAVRKVKKEGCTYIIGQSDVPAMQKVFYNSGLTITNCTDFRFYTL